MLSSMGGLYTTGCGVFEPLRCSVSRAGPIREDLRLILQHGSRNAVFAVR